MIVTVIANGRQYNYTNISSYDKIKNDDETYEILINKESVLELNSEPEMVTVSGFSSVQPVDSKRETKDSPQYQSDNMDKLNVGQSYMTLRYRLYESLDPRSAYQLIATANSMATRDTPGYVYLYAICKCLRPQQELDSIQFEKYVPDENDWNTERIQENFTLDDVYQLQKEDEKQILLPKMLYEYADDSVASDLIGGAGNKMVTNQSENYAQQLVKICREYLSDVQLEALNISEMNQKTV